MSRKLLRVGLVIALWAPIFVGAAGVARSLGAEDFSGFDMGAKSTAVQFVFNSPSLGVPAKPTGELNFAFSEATLQSGPAAYGLGSIVWPGQVVAALPPFLQKTIETEAGQEFFPADVPPYPIRAESFHPQGPATSSLDAGSMHMRSSAKEKSAEGISYLNTFTLPFVGSMGNMSSSSQDGFDPDGAVAMTEASASDISLLSGLIKIDSVVTRATARSNGEKASVAGTTTVTGAEVSGMKVVIDNTGVHVADQSMSSASQQQALNQVLKQAGVTIELAPPVDTKSGPKASRALNGLLVRIEVDTLEPLIAALPAELQSEIRGQFTLDQAVAIQIAPAVVSAGAARAIAFEPPIDVPPVIDGSGGSGGSDAGSLGAETPVGDAGGDVGSSGDGVAVGAEGSGTPVAFAPLRTSFSGVPLWLFFGLTLLAFASSRPLTMVADRILAAGAGSARCPYERS